MNEIQSVSCAYNLIYLQPNDPKQLYCRIPFQLVFLLSQSNIICGYVQVQKLLKELTRILRLPYSTKQPFLYVWKLLSQPEEQFHLVFAFFLRVKIALIFHVGQMGWKMKVIQRRCAMISPDIRRWGNQKFAQGKFTTLEVGLSLPASYRVPTPSLRINTAFCKTKKTFLPKLMKHDSSNKLPQRKRFNHQTNPLLHYIPQSHAQIYPA